MKTQALPALTLGLDVLSPETTLAQGAVRVARNIAILDDGTFQRRPGYTTLSALAGAHSLWRSPAQTRTLVAAGSTLYDVTVDTGAVSPLFTDLPFEQPVSYEDVGPDIYCTAGGVLRKIDVFGVVRRPGVADLLGDTPTLTSAAGGLYPGRYGVAYSLVNDLGEESGLSSIAWITLAADAGITLSGLQSAPDAVALRVYVTSANGEALYLHDTRALAASTTISDQTTGRVASRQYLHAMPGGSIVRLHKGRLYVADGKWLWISNPLDYGVADVKAGWLTFNRTITMLEAVDGGLFVGLRERTLFLRGNAPKDFVQVNVADRGALSQATRVAADFLSPDLAPNRDLPCAVWLSDAGVAVGHPDGSIAFPQAGRISVAGSGSRPLFLRQSGIRQGIFCVESLTLGAGGAVDLTI